MPPSPATCGPASTRDSIVAARIVFVSCGHRASDSEIALTRSTERYDPRVKIGLLAVIVGVAAGVPRTSAASRECGGDSGWASDGAQLAPHPHVVYWMNKVGTQQRLPTSDSLVAKIDGKPVATRVLALHSHPNKLAVIYIDSDATGALTLEWARDQLPIGHYTITSTSYPKVAHATTSRFREPSTFPGAVLDGLAIKVDVPAMWARVKLRYDAHGTWRALDVPVEADGRLRIGMLGCGGNYEPQLLEQGVDIEVLLVLPDGNAISVEKLTHVSIPKLAN
jgi:hypothetical protein